VSNVSRHLAFLRFITLVSFIEVFGLPERILTVNGVIELGPDDSRHGLLTGGRTRTEDTPVVRPATWCLLCLFIASKTDLLVNP